MSKSEGPVNSGRTHISGARVWLTGASYGIGRALALELARRGAIVGVTARSEESLLKLKGEIESAGGKAIVLVGDVTDHQAMVDLAAAMRSEVGGIDILIANAGTHLFTRVEEFDVEEYMHLMNLNYGGVLNCISAALPDMLSSGSGHLVGVASLAGYRAVPRAAAYGASKSAVIHFLEAIRFHLADHGIPVTVVNPGFVRTPLTDKNDFRMPFLIESDHSARIICDGIEKKRKEISFPFPFSWMIKLMRIIPMPIYSIIMRRIWKRMKNA